MKTTGEVASGSINFLMTRSLACAPAHTSPSVSKCATLPRPKACSKHKTPVARVIYTAFPGVKPAPAAARARVSGGPWNSLGWHTSARRGIMLYVPLQETKLSSRRVWYWILAGDAGVVSTSCLGAKDARSGDDTRLAPTSWQHTRARAMKSDIKHSLHAGRARPERGYRRCLLLPVAFFRGWLSYAFPPPG